MEVLRRAVLCLATVPAGSTVVAPAASSSEGDYAKYTDLAYVPRGNAQQVLDLYVPKSNRPLGLIVYVHGGGWGAGNKSEIEQQPGWPTFLSRGFAIASINYTLTGTASFPWKASKASARCPVACRLLSTSSARRTSSRWTST